MNNSVNQVHNNHYDNENKEKNMKIAEKIFAFLMGYFIYSLVEIAARGYTHWTMALTGGVVLAVLYDINTKAAMSLIKSCFIGAVFITAMELVVGVVVNLVMRWNVWDYKSMPLNVMGQICLYYSFGWFLLCIPAYFLCMAIRIRFRGPRPA